jgi:hypothetical protein
VLSQLDGPRSAVPFRSGPSRAEPIGTALARACARAPVYLALDDLDAAGPEAVALARYVVGLRLPLLLVVTVRDPGTVPAGIAAGAVSIGLRAADPVRAPGVPLLVRQRRGWLVSWGGRHAVVEDLVGVRHLARLLDRPGVPVPAAELVGSTGLVGATGGAERARVAVRKAIKRAVDRIADADPVIGGELLSAVSTGYSCCYAAATGCGRPAAS